MANPQGWEAENENKKPSTVSGRGCQDLLLKSRLACAYIVP